MSTTLQRYKATRNHDPSLQDKLHSFFSNMPSLKYIHKNIHISLDQSSLYRRSRSSRDSEYIYFQEPRPRQCIDIQPCATELMANRIHRNGTGCGSMDILIEHSISNRGRVNTADDLTFRRPLNGFNDASMTLLVAVDPEDRRLMAVLGSTLHLECVGGSSVLVKTIKPRSRSSRRLTYYYS